VLLVVEGGSNTIRIVLKSVTSNPAVPIVVAEGSGRAADILAYAYELDGCVFSSMIRQNIKRKSTSYKILST